jgi:hypothetical protein
MTDEQRSLARLDAMDKRMEARFKQVMDAVEAIESSDDDGYVCRSWQDEFPEHSPNDPVAPARNAQEHTIFGENQLFRIRQCLINAQPHEFPKMRERLAFVVGQYAGGGEMAVNAAFGCLISAVMKHQNDAATLSDTRARFTAGMKHPRSWATDLGEFVEPANNLDDQLRE